MKAAYETYKNASFKGKECSEAFKYAEQTQCIISYERNFLGQCPAKSKTQNWVI